MPKTRTKKGQASPAATGRKHVDLKFHPLSTIFPMLGEAELQTLSRDIAENGLQVPITLHEGKILDGRNRHVVCIMARIKPVFVEYDGDDPVKFVLSTNLHRRHLNESQRAMVAAKLANMRQGERTDLEPSENLPKVSQVEANRADRRPATSDGRRRFCSLGQRSGIE